MARARSTQSATKRWMLAAVAAALVVATGVVTAPSASPATSSQSARLRAIEASRLTALVAADTATARKLIAPDFQLINPGGTTLSRADLLGGVRAGAIDFRAIRPTRPIAVRLSGNSATLRYEETFDLVAGGIHLSHKAWTTALYERRSGRWQIVWEQTTAVPNRPELFLESIKPVS
jgi:Domain of unknown function (DUF4440)